MSMYIVDGDDLTAIANAIRAKTDTNAAIEVADMADAIDGIELNYPGLLTPLEFDWNVGWVATGVWTYESPTDSYCDIYEVVNGHNYTITLGNTVGTRFRCMTTDVDIREVTSGKVTGVNVNNVSDPAAQATKSFTSTVDGYLVIAKDNVGVTGIMTYVMDRSVV